MPRIIYCIFFLFVYFGYTQENLQKYREDQIYFSVYYNSLGNNLDNFKENKFSSSFNFGFIRDIPLSKSGKFAIGVGLGVGINAFNNNMKLSNSNSYILLNNRDIPKKNVFIPIPNPRPTAKFPDFDKGISLINPKLMLVENLFSLKLLRLSPREL